MLIDKTPFRTIWVEPNGRHGSVKVIDQTVLPHRFVVKTLATAEESATAIRDMTVRGAPLIGATGAYGLALAMAEEPTSSNLEAAFDLLIATRPTAVNLRWGLERMRRRLAAVPEADRAATAFAEAAAIADEDVAVCSALGQHGADLIRDQWERAGRSRVINILTHCNAGWLATVDWGTALAPIYKAHRAGLPVHVWVDETRPRNQGASLTAYELGQEGVPHTIVVDNVGGHLMQHGQVDLCIVGTDRTTRTGDVCNKIGTYLKALAAHDNGVPFYVALPASTIDWRLSDGRAEIPIEERSPLEVTHISGVTASGAIETVRITPEGSPALNYAFDVTPARLVTGLITEAGVCAASEEGLLSLFPLQEAA
ncbi:S-methyl-5-thioribose-1-phosphate isomerase [Lichenihabitans sp. PAMC28606]|uniref:S-methyl-5-thioribose-1-phosphate isomerase n=1 Tax=Lichenihabitans sp. PAMC28606 TaxID=2880932 RepID=UPI001D0A577A|nr:S-methyl-5-thioribose-1-phosphate isomerase [Lichenihabitans sp. PAMC28606]UDL95187.1 S-methyl-5-thioribose-1-phosphate isomerase [Lichenihabitans sp. PAMC28606]